MTSTQKIEATLKAAKALLGSDWTIFMDGHCDALAIALFNHIEFRYPDLRPTISRIERIQVEFDKHGQETRTVDNHLSHVVVDVGRKEMADAPLECFDIEGAGAFDRWVREWDLNCQDPHEPSDTEFDSVEDTAEGLVALRARLKESDHDPTELAALWTHALAAIDEGRGREDGQICEALEASARASRRLYGQAATPGHTQASQQREIPRLSDLGDEIHWVKTSVLSGLANPFEGCWLDIDKPLRLEDVTAALQEQDIETTQSADLQATPKLLTDEQSLERNRKVHARKVAWFVKNGFQQPLDIDVGVPSLGCHVQYIVQDGNHRLAAAIYRAKVFQENPVLPLIIQGSVEHAREIGLWQHELHGESEQDPPPRQRCG